MVDRLHVQPQSPRLILKEVRVCVGGVRICELYFSAPFFFLSPSYLSFSSHICDVMREKGAMTRKVGRHCLPHLSSGEGGKKSAGGDSNGQNWWRSRSG